MRTKRIVITGGTGFVGANLTRALLSHGHDVHLLVREGAAMWRIEDIQSSLSVHTVSLLNQAELTHLLSKVAPDWIFHLAAYGAYSWQSERTRIFETNFGSAMALLEAARATGFESLIMAGSSSEYGFKDHPPRESEREEPNSDYAVSKVCATHFAQHFAKHHDLNICVFRLYSVYGPYEDPNRLFPSLLREGFNGQFPPLVSPQTARDFIHVADVCESFIEAASKAPLGKAEVFNIGTGIQTTMESLVSLVAELLDIKAKPPWGSMNPRVWDTSLWCADITKVRQVFGWAPKLDLRQGLELLITCTKCQPEKTRSASV